MEVPPSRTPLAYAAEDLLVRSHHLSNRLRTLRYHKNPASREFQYTGSEFGIFYATYQTLYPKFRNGLFLSPTCLEIIAKMSEDMSTFCRELLEEIDNFQRRDRIASQAYIERNYACFLFGGRNNSEKARNKRILKFFRENNMELRRSQLGYATLLLQVILAVVVHAQDQLPGQGASNVNGFHNYLVESAIEALDSLESTETDLKSNLRVNSLPIEASRWWDGFPLAPGAVQTNQLEELARVWVNPEAKIPHDGTADVNKLQTMVRRLRSDHAQELRELRGDQQTRMQEHAAELRRINEAWGADRTRYAADRLQWVSERDYDREQIRELTRSVNSLKGMVQKLSEDLNHEKKSNRQEEARLRGERNSAERHAKEAEQEIQERAMAQDKLERRSKLVQRENELLQGKLLQLAPSGHPSERSSSSTRTRRSSNQTSHQMSPISRRERGPPISYDNRAKRPPSPSSGSTTAAEEAEIIIYNDFSEAPHRRSRHSRRSRHIPGV